MPQLKSLKIAHYKGFFEEEEIEFAIPDGSNPGSGLTLIVGPNNTGKTTVLEALLLKDNKRFKESERHRGNAPLITIESDNGTCVFTNVEDGSQIKMKEDSIAHGIKFEVIQSRRYWNYMSGSNWNSEQFLNQTESHEIRNAGAIDTAAVLKEINKNSEQKKKFNDLVKQIIPHFTNWTIDTNDQGDYVKYITANTEHQANFLGDGIISIFRICAHLVSDSKDRVLIIDEPELSLHPTAQKALSKILSKGSKEKQIILCTHSPYFANWQDFINGGYFVRLNKVKDEKCTVSTLDNSKKYTDFISNNHLEWQKPQLLDLVAKELLFSERVLFTEGQEDVGLIRKWLNEESKEINFDIFGYGVGSYSNMKLFLELAKDLGLKTVAALYDDGESAESIFLADTESFKEYCLRKLPTKDIRDKHAQCGNCNLDELIKEGCFDKSGSLKSDKKMDFEKSLNEIITYFAT